MKPNSSIQFFDQQFQQQVKDSDFQLNPFELAALPYLHGRVLDFGCGMGNLALAAARRGCSVLALDASAAAIDHIQRQAKNENLPVIAHQADLRHYNITEDFDVIVSIGLLMFFDCSTALQMLSNIQAQVRPGGTAIVNVLVEGTTYLDMFDPSNHCLFARPKMANCFAGWNIALSEFRDFDAPGQRIKSFSTLIAHKPLLRFS